MTPREIKNRILSVHDKRVTGDLMAWIAARYIMLSVHAPGKLPLGPVFFPPERQDMTDEEMKARFQALKEQV